MTKTAQIYYPKGDIEKSFINSIWRLSELGLHNKKEIILPKGTVEIIFNFSDRITYFNPSTQTLINLPHVFINGVNFKPFELIKSGRQEFLGIQLNSIGLKLLFNLSAKEFNNRVYEGDIVCSTLGSLANELHFIKSFNRQVEIILKWIKSKLARLNLNHQIHRAHKLLVLNENNLNVKKITDEIYVSERHLRRFSNEWLGMNTEEFIHYKKYLSSLTLLHNTEHSLTEIGLMAGYYDQSHFIREFKSFTGLTPKQYKQANKGIPGHIFI